MLFEPQDIEVWSVVHKKEITHTKHSPLFTGPEEAARRRYEELKAVHRQGTLVLLTPSGDPAALVGVSWPRKRRRK